MRRIQRGLVVAGLIALTATAAPSSDPLRAAAPPTGFSDAAVASFNRPTAVEWLPDDRIAVLEQGGRIRVGRPGQAFQTALTISNICTNGERGLLGLTPGPSFLGDGFVYVYYTRPSATAPGGCVNRVSRFQLVGDLIDPASENVLLDNISSVNSNHNGGDLDVGSDGFLYVSVGDAGRDPRLDSGSAGSNDAAQDLSLLNGKILRVTLGGLPAPGNPLTGPGTARCGLRGNTPTTPTSTCQELFAWGLRNPYRIAFDRNDGADRFFVNDVGQGTFEEVNDGAVGRNYGWPMREGPCPQGETPTCTGPPPGLTDPIMAYGRHLGTYVTAGAFVPNGLWPSEYDGGYLFADGGSGRIWLRAADGSVDYDVPFATGAYGITDMTFGFDAGGRMVLYYVQVGGTLRAISSTAPLGTPPAGGLKLIPIPPFRAYDTGHDIGVASGNVFNGTTRLVDLDPPTGFEAALVNLTYDATAGPGWIRTWGTRAARPSTSSLNADGPGSIVANSAIVALDTDGTFVLESSTTGRVIVDVMAWLDDTGGAGTSHDGRFVALTPIRLADTRIPAGSTLTSGSPNPWTAHSDGFDIEVSGLVGVPDDAGVAAVAISVAAISNGASGWVGAYPGGSTYAGTSNVNVVAGDTRANVMVVPLDGASFVSMRTLNVSDVVVDVVGYLTSETAPALSSGLFSFVDPVRAVDTRLPIGFGRLEALSTATVSYPGGTSASAVVQNVTVTNTAAAGYVAAHPTDVVPFVSNVNFVGPDQTRAALAFTEVAADGRGRFTALVPTDLVVDVVGYFAK